MSLIDPIVCVCCVRSLLCCVVIFLFSSFAIITLRKSERAGCFTFIVFLMLCDCNRYLNLNHNWLVCSYLFTFCSHVAFSILCLILSVPWVDSSYLIMTFPSHAHLVLDLSKIADSDEVYCSYGD